MVIKETLKLKKRLIRPFKNKEKSTDKKESTSIDKRKKDKGTNKQKGTHYLIIIGLINKIYKQNHVSCEAFNMFHL